MKKLFLILVTAALLLCSACGASSDVEGTWYSVTDATMYNFANGEVKVSGVTVGQYEDNGDSVVVSLMDDGSNMLLYVTKMDKVDVLADVKQGDGKIYFCKGLENAQKIIEDAKRAEEEAKAAQEAEIQEFAEYIRENLMGVWVSDGPGPLYSKIEFCTDGSVIKTLTSGEVETERLVTNSDSYIIFDSEYETLTDGRGHPIIYIYASVTGTKYGADDIRFTPGDDPTGITIRIYGWPYTKQ